MRNADGSLSPRLAQSFGNRLVAARARKIVTDKECAYLEEELRGYMDAKGTDKLTGRPRPSRSRRPTGKGRQDNAMNTPSRGELVLALSIYRALNDEGKRLAINLVDAMKAAQGMNVTQTTEAE